MAASPGGRHGPSDSSYSADEVVRIIKKFEATAKKMVSSKSGAAAMLAAAELNLLTATEAVRDVCQLAVKDSSVDGRDHLVAVFGGSCEKIGRLLHVLDTVGEDFSGENAKDQRWHDTRESIQIIKAILEQLGAFKVWTPGSEHLPPTELVFTGLAERYEAGDKVHLELEYTGGDPTEYSIDRPLPAGLRFDRRTGKITGKCDPDLPDQSFIITAKNENGAGTVELLLKMGPPAPSVFRYPGVPSRLLLGNAVQWTPEFEGTRCVFRVTPSLPAGLQMDPKTGSISGKVTEVGNYKWSISASNANGQIEAMFSVAVVDFRIAEEICSCTDLESLWKLEQDRAESVPNWMIWMVHRVYLNDHTLTERNFTNMPMPPPKIEPRIARKLMQSLVSNTHLESLLLSGTKLRPPSGLDLAESLRRNTTLRVINMETNLLTVDVIQAITLSLAESPNCNVQEWKFNNQAGLPHFGDSTEERIAEMMKVNTKILKLGCAFQNGGHRSTIDRCILKNSDLKRKVKSGSAYPATATPDSVTSKADPAAQKASEEIVATEVREEAATAEVAGKTAVDDVAAKEAEEMDKDSVATEDSVAAGPEEKAADAEVGAGESESAVKETAEEADAAGVRAEHKDENEAT